MEKLSECLRPYQQRHPTTTSFVHGYTPTRYVLPPPTTTTTTITSPYVSPLQALTNRRRRCWPMQCSRSSRFATTITASVVEDSSTPVNDTTTDSSSSSLVNVDTDGPAATNATVAVDSAVIQATTKGENDGSDGKPQRYYNTFEWRGYNVNYLAEGPASAKPVLFVHGFGASINHWRKNIPALLETGTCRVYAIDLLGLGASTKASPDEVPYSIELWTEQVIDFIHYIDRIDNNNNKNSNTATEQQNNVDDATTSSHVQWTLVGNSIGSLICLNATAQLGQPHIRSLVLMNCAGGLVSFRYSELNPLQRIFFYLFNALLFNPIVGRYLFENIRRPEQLRDVLQQIYPDRGAITDELLDILSMPAFDDGALEVFLAILNGPPGPEPEPLLEQVKWCPTLVLWGEKDPWTPLETGYHRGIDFPRFHEGLVLKTIPGAGHCIHDEVPQVVNPLFVPFVENPTFREDDGGNQTGDGAAGV